MYKLIATLKNAPKKTENQWGIGFAVLATDTIHLFLRDGVLEDWPRPRGHLERPREHLEDKILWPLPWPRRCVAFALAVRSGRKTLNFWVWLISKGLNTINAILHTQAQEAAVRRWIWEWWTDRRRGITALCVASRGKSPGIDVLEDWPRSRGHLEDYYVALALALASTMLSSNTSLLFLIVLTVSYSTVQLLL